MQPPIIQWLFGLLVFGISHLLQAQQISIQQDFGAWIGLQLEHKITKSWEVSFEQQIRTQLQAGPLTDYWAELGFSHTLNKNFKLAGNLRYIHEMYQWQDSRNSLRYNLDLKLRIPLPKKWRISYRVRYQQKFIDALCPQPTTIAFRNTTLRHQFKVIWKYQKKHRLYASAEFFMRSNPLEEAYWKQARICVGDKIKSKIGVFNLALGYETNLQPDDEFSLFFLKLIYHIEL